jgi:putative flippase GtrA
MLLIKYLSNIRSFEFIKYLFVGGANFIFSIVLFFLFLKVLLVDYMVSFVITWLFGIFLTYIINFLWVFKPEEKLEFKKRLPKYFMVYVISFIVNIIILRFLVKTYDVDPFWIQFFILPIVVLINFFGFKLWALK